MKELNLIQTTLIAKKGQWNDFGKYHYRSLEDITESMKPLLEKYKCTLVMSDDVMLVGDRIYVKATATITNSEGASVSATGFAREAAIKKGMDDSQITGTASSYARKYALNGLFAIDDVKDSDTLNDRKVKVEGYKTVSKATDAEKKAYWSEFQMICDYQEVDAMAFIADGVDDITDKKAVHNLVVKWLSNQEQLNDQLISFKHRDN